MDSSLPNVLELSRESLICLAEKCYRSVYINKSYYEAIFRQLTVLPLTPENQAKILNSTVNSCQVQEYPPPLSFRKFFLRILLNEVEGSGCEVSEELFIAYADSLTETTSQDSLWFHCYFISEKEVITIRENPNLVVKSTTGLRTWEAAKYLTEWCIENSFLFKSRRILELGSGTGLLGITICKLLEPSLFVFTDKSPDVLRLLSSNLQINLHSAKAPALLQVSDKNGESLYCNESCSYSSCKIDVCHLEWENTTSLEASAWSPDVILAADLVYDPSTVPHLVRVIHNFLINGTECAYVACTLRNEDTYSCFLKHLDSFSLRKEDLAEPEKLELFYDDKSCLEICKISLL